MRTEKFSVRTDIDAVPIRKQSAALNWTSEQRGIERTKVFQLPFGDSADLPVVSSWLRKFCCQRAFSIKLLFKLFRPPTTICFGWLKFRGWSFVKRIISRKTPDVCGPGSEFPWCQDCEKRFFFASFPRGAPVFQWIPASNSVENRLKSF